MLCLLLWMDSSFEKHIFLQLMLTPAATQHTHFGKSKNWFTTPQSVDEEREGNLQ